MGARRIVICGLEVSVTERLKLAAAPGGIISGGEKLKMVLFGSSGELPPVTGTTVAVTLFAPVVPMTVAEVNRSALSKEIVTEEVVISPLQLLTTWSVPPFTLLPELPEVWIGAVPVAIA